MSHFSKEIKKEFSITRYEYNDETTNRVISFIGKYVSCSEPSDEEMSAEDLAETYRELLTEWKKYCLRE